MNAALKLSVVIPTYNRCETLDMVIDHLEKQSVSHEDFEVLILDDGSHDETPARMEKRKERTSFRLRYYRHENHGPGYTQNRGIREATADLVLIIADDILASENLLHEHLRMHRQYPQENVAILGKVLQSEALPQTVFQRNWDPFGYDRLAGKTELPSLYFLGCNISFKKRFLLENGLFLERKGAAHEDVELGYRLGRKGLEILYCEKALGFHHHLENFPGACNRAYERGWNFDLLSNNIPKDYILPFYSILSFEAGLKAFLRTLPKELIRRIIFNGVTVPRFWQPILEQSEESFLGRLVATPLAYKGTVGYFMRCGYQHKQNGKEKNFPY